MRFLLLGLLFWAGNSLAANVEKGQAHILDWDGGARSSFKLEGDWWYFESQLLQPAEVLNAPKNLTLKVPGARKEQGLSGQGYGTYGTEIHVDQSFKPRDLSVWMGGPGFASESWIYRLGPTGLELGELLAHVVQGKVGKTVEEERAFEVSEAAILKSIAPGDRLLFVMQLSNQFHARGSAPFAPEFGESDFANHKKLTEHLVDFFCFGVFVVFGVYHLLLFYLRRNDRASIGFSAVCFSMAIRVAMTGRFLNLAYGPLTDDWTVLAYRIEYASIGMIVISLTSFLQDVLSFDRKALVNRIIIGVSILQIGVASFTPATFFTYSILPTNLLILIAAIAGLYWVAKAIRVGTPMARPIALSLLCMVGFSFVDILKVQGLHQLPFVAGLGVVLAILIQSGILAYQFSRAFVEKDQLNRELLSTYEALEDELKKRKKLIAKNDELKEEMKRATQMLLEADQMSSLGQAVAGVAHDIAGPTGLILSSHEAELGLISKTEKMIFDLMGEPDGEEAKRVVSTFQGYFAEARTGLKEVESGAKKIAALNQAIRNQARNDETQKDVMIRPLIDECVTILSGQLGKVTLEVDCPSDLAVDCKRSQMGQVIIKLLQMKLERVQAGRVCVKAFMQEREVVFELHDDQPKLEESVSPGSDLGLSVVRKIIASHGGELSEGSSKLWVGSLFRVSVRRSQA